MPITLSHSRSLNHSIYSDSSSDSSLPVSNDVNSIENGNSINNSSLEDACEDEYLEDDIENLPIDDVGEDIIPENHTKDTPEDSSYKQLSPLSSLSNENEQSTKTPPNSSKFDNNNREIFEHSVNSNKQDNDAYEENSLILDRTEKIADGANESEEEYDFDNTFSAVGIPDLAKCAVCDALYDKKLNFKMLSCLCHIVCQKCQQDSLDFKNCSKCPNFRLPVPKSYYLSDALCELIGIGVNEKREVSSVSPAKREISSSTPPKYCSWCKEAGEHTVTAMFHCQQCEIDFCSECNRGHQRLPTSRSHCVLSLNLNGQKGSSAEDQTIESAALSMCTQHPGEVLEIYCDTCEETTCRNCQLSGAHAGHKHLWLHEKCAQMANRIRSHSLTTLQNLCHKMDLDLKEISEHGVLLKKQVQSTKVNLDKHCDNLVQSIRNWQHEETKKLSTISAKEEDVLNQRKQDCSNNLILIEFFKNLTEKLCNSTEEKCSVNMPLLVELQQPLLQRTNNFNKRILRQHDLMLLTGLISASYPPQSASSLLFDVGSGLSNQTGDTQHARNSDSKSSPVFVTYMPWEGALPCARSGDISLLKRIGSVLTPQNSICENSRLHLFSKRPRLDLNGNTSSLFPSDCWPEFCQICGDSRGMVICHACNRFFHSRCHLPNCAEDYKMNPSLVSHWLCILCRDLPSCEQVVQILSSSDQRKWIQSNEIKMYVCKFLISLSVLPYRLILCSMSHLESTICPDMKISTFEIVTRLLNKLRDIKLTRSSDSTLASENVGLESFIFELKTCRYLELNQISEIGDVDFCDWLSRLKHFIRERRSFLKNCPHMENIGLQLEIALEDFCAFFDYVQKALSSRHK